MSKMSPVDQRIAALADKMVKLSSLHPASGVLRVHFERELAGFADWLSGPGGADVTDELPLGISEPEEVV